MSNLPILVLAAIIGSVLTYYLQRAGVSSVVASCVVGLGGALIASYLKSPHIAAVVFTGSFVGMTDLEIATLSKVSVGGALSGLIYWAASNIFPGYGGRLGTIAFISVVLVVVFYKYMLGRSKLLNKS